jgi:hypothetical protein
MSDKTSQYIDKKTGATVELTDYQYRLTSNRFTPVEAGKAVKKSPAGGAEDDENDLLDARLEYEKLTGQKAGNRKLETLKKEIEEHKAK